MSKDRMSGAKKNNKKKCVKRGGRKGAERSEEECTSNIENNEF